MHKVEHFVLILHNIHSITNIPKSYIRIWIYNFWETHILFKSLDLVFEENEKLNGVFNGGLANDEKRGMINSKLQLTNAMGWILTASASRLIQNGGSVGLTQSV